ncbi:MAG: hypothetical protein KGL39_32710 [Patescibacteria group bacterium]|nr:hypothetical protein [Patescibacteria group bacterium]
MFSSLTRHCDNAQELANERFDQAAQYWMPLVATRAEEMKLLRLALHHGDFTAAETILSKMIGPPPPGQKSVAAPSLCMLALFGLDQVILHVGRKVQQIIDNQ